MANNMSKRDAIGGRGGNWGLTYLLGIPFRTRKSAQGMKALQDRRLAWLVRHAWNTIPLYRALLEQQGIDPFIIRGLDDIERLPLVSRRTLRDGGERAWSTDLPAKHRIMASTSGSSDQPLALAYCFSDRLRKHAIGLHCMSMYGWRPWHRGMALGSEALPRDHPFTRVGLARWQWVDPSRPVREWLEEYKRLRPHALHSYPSALREFCFEARENGPLEWIPRVLSVGGEFNPPELAPLARAVFGRPPLTMYGAVEGGRLAFECRAHNGFHVRPDAVHVEILQDGKAVELGKSGVVYITSLINTVMPIIRYELGDLAAWAPGECPCGLWWPRISIQQGRTGDVILLSGGRRIPVTRLASIVGKSQSVRQFQFLRRAEDLLVLRYEPHGEVRESLEPFIEKLRESLPGIRVEAERYGQLPRTRSGKVTRYIDETPVDTGRETT